MTYDVAFRHQQALDPSALTTIATTLHAIEAAITDCRNAGKDAEADPAVVLLARHLGAVCQAHPADPELRRRSMAEIARLRQFPTLRTLAIRGVAYDEAAKRAFHGEGRRALRRLAEALGLEPGVYDLRCNRAGPAVSGEITLHGDEVWVRRSARSAPTMRYPSAACPDDPTMSATATAGLPSGSCSPPIASPTGSDASSA